MLAHVHQGLRGALPVGQGQEGRRVACLLYLVEQGGFVYPR